ncbi:amino acid kinase family protein [Methylorubrum thiocyanatum]|uniref:amino acid kinase family protein n=1 Tax=Methylorubrum thiocyanatum TaxID=47958 RepID=UPI0036694A44
MTGAKPLPGSGQSRARLRSGDGRTGAAVVKIGGSLVSDRARLRTILSECADSAPVAIVPGGGPFADAVRTTQAQLGFDDRLAHRLALDAMGRMAEVFCALEPRLAVAASPEGVADALGRGRSVIWDPVALKAGHPDIPESWDVTSDSLALWLATRLGAGRCILVKSANLLFGTDPEILARDGLVDAAFPGFAAGYPGTILIRGPEALHERHAA